MCTYIILQVVLDSAERCFTQFLIEMVVNKRAAEFGAACELLLVRARGGTQFRLQSKWQSGYMCKYWDRTIK